MSKKITNHELAELVSQLLTNPSEVGELEDLSSYQGFMTDIAEVVCNYCGGEVGDAFAADAEGRKIEHYIEIRPNDSLPDNGGVWKNFDSEGELAIELALKNLGLEVISTGGSSEGWHARRGDFYVLVTNEVDAAKPLYPSSHLGVGFYGYADSATQEPVFWCEGTWERVRLAIESFVHGEWTPTETAAE